MSRRSEWPRLAVDAWMMGMDAAAVIGLRMIRLSTFDRAAALEAERMVSEKFEAVIALQVMALTGQLGSTPSSLTAKSLRHYRRKIRANRRRLEKT